MKTKSVIIERYLHKIKITANDQSDEGVAKLLTAEYIDNGGLFDAVAGIINNIAEGHRSGQFHWSEPMFDEDPIYIEGAWEIIPDYTSMHRIMKWIHNAQISQTERFTEQDFVSFFGHVGRHYFEKFSTTYDRNIFSFINYIGNDIQTGESFMQLLFQKVDAYEKRLLKERKMREIA